MLRFLPAGWMGLMLGGLIAANSSTILTHLNWGASYLVHDFYRRFVKPGADRTALRAGRPRRDRAAVRRLLGAWSSLLDTAQGQLQPHPPDRRRHGPAVPGALVLVARHRVVRNRRDGQLVRWSRCCSWSLTRNGVAIGHRAAADHHDRGHDGLLDRDGLSGPADRSSGAGRLLSQRCGPSARAGSRCRRRRAPVRSSSRRQLPAGAGRLDHRLHHDLVGAVHGRQFPVRPDGLWVRAAGGIRGLRRDPDRDRPPALE